MSVKYIIVVGERSHEVMAPLPPIILWNYETRPTAVSGDGNYITWGLGHRVERPWLGEYSWQIITPGEFQSCCKPKPTHPTPGPDHNVPGPGPFPIVEVPDNPPGGPPRGIPGRDDTVATPEPGTGLLLAGALVLGAIVRRLR